MTPSKPGKSTARCAALGAALWLLAASCAAQTAADDQGGIRISGFGTLGVVHVDAPAGWGFGRSVEQPAGSGSTRADVDSRLGVQINYAPTSKVEFVGQLLATHRLPDASDGDAIEWAFAAYRPTAGLAIRLGRLNLDQYLMSDYRNVGFAYLPARPPVEYYGSVPSAFDGIDVAQTWDSDDTRWRAKGVLGRSKTAGIRLNDVYGFALSRESGSLLLRAGWSRAKLAHNADTTTQLIAGLAQMGSLPVPSIAAEVGSLRRAMDLAAEPLVYINFGASYEPGDWQYAVELTRMSVGQSIIRAGYASIGRRFGELTVFGIASGAGSGSDLIRAPAWQAALTPIIGPAAAQQAQALGSASAYVASRSLRQTTYSIGVRWDVHPRMAVKVQWDDMRIRANGAYLWSHASDAPSRAHLGTVLLDFVF